MTNLTEVLALILNSFFSFLGTIIILALIANGTANIIEAITNGIATIIKSFKKQND